MTIKRLFFIIMPILIMILTNHAAATVAAHVDRTQMNLGESFVLTISVPKGSKPDLAPLSKDFQLYGETTSSAISIVNGNKTSSHRLIITLMPKIAGTLTIPAIKVGQDQTQPITITVSKPSPDQIGGNKSALFLQASLAQTKGYVNSPILYTLKLYYANQLTGGQIAPQPNNDFTVTPIGKNSKYQATVDNKTYQVVEQQFLLTPTKSGALTIKPAIFQGAVASNQNNGFGFFSMSTGKPISVQSNSLKFDALPIPVGIHPSTWLPAQHVSLTSKWTPNATSLETGTPVTRTVTVTAQGISSHLLPDLELPTPVSMNAYPDKTQTKDGITGNQLVGQKVYKIAYIPTATGVVNFPAIKLKWWDSRTGEAHTASLPAERFDVKAGKTSTQGVMIASQQNREMRSTVAPAQSVTKVVVEKSGYYWIYLSAIFFSLWILTLLAWLIVTKYRHRDNHVAARTLSQPRHSDNLKSLHQQLKLECQKNDARKIQEILIKWAGIYWQDQSVRSLHGVRQYVVEESLLTQLTELERTIYHGGDYQQGQALWSAFNNISNAGKHSNDSLMKPFYPDE